eukprot:gene12499-13785_t
MDGNDNSRESPSQQNQMDRERIATLLRNAIQLVGLNSGSNWGSMNTSEQSQPTGLGQLQLDRAPRPTSPSHMSINGMPSRRIPSGESAHTAFSRCFPAARGIPNPTGRRKRAASTRFPAPYFVPPTTWTHEFFLLSKSSARHTPERSQIDTMQKAGLGRCKVVFEDKRGDHAHVRATLEKYYPKLASQNGAFQLLRCLSGGCGTRELSVIPMGVDGYPVSLLKEVCKSSTIYIRPMQTSLSMESVLPDVPQTVYQGNIAMAQCLNCNSEVELSKFNDHTANCPKMYASIDDCVLPSEVKEYDHKAANSNSILHTLQTIFVDKEIEELQRAATQSSDVHAAVDVILDAQRGDLPTSSVVVQPTGSASHNNVETATISSLQQLLVQFQEEHHSTQEVKISVDRDEIWRCGLLFYKKCIANPSRLHMNVEVNFTDLTGQQSSMDAGALATEFFGALLKEASLRLLEGMENNLVPKRSGGNVTNFVILGMLIGHSLLHRGPCLPVMAPWVYDMISGKMAFDDVATKITKAMIPLNAASSTALEVIDLLDKCTDNASIDVILDTPNYMQIINSSQWDPTEVVNMESKGRVITEIIYDELVLKRKEQITAIREGLTHVGFLKHIEAFPELCRPVFVGGSVPVTSASFINLLGPIETEDRTQEQVKSWF